MIETALARITPARLRPRRLTPRRLTPRRALIAIALVMVALGTVLWAAYVWTDYRTTLNAARSQGWAAIDALSEHTTRLVFTNDLLLQQLAGMVEQHGIEHYHSSELAWRQLRDLAEISQQSVVLGVVDHTGKGVLSSRSFGPPPPESNAEQLAFFAAHRDSEAQSLLIGPTVFSPVDGKPLLVFSRRWQSPSGDFRGVLASGVRADVFLEVAEKLAFGPTSTLSIVRDDGLVLIRRPLTPEVVRLRLEDYELFTDHLARASEGEYPAVSPADGERRLVLYRKLADLPLVMIVGLSVDDILSRWRTRALAAGVLVLMGFVSIGALTVFGVRRADREALALRQLEEARDHERLLVSEIDHRSKNLLSIIQAQIRQTARSAKDKHQLVEKLTGRIDALAAAHELLSAKSWRQIDLRSLVERETMPFAGEDRVAIRGDSILISAKAAVTLALVLHELATNATKYGALSTSDGRVDLAWAVIDDSPRRLKMTWRESGGPPVKPPRTKGFGTTLIERSLPHEVNGAASLQFLPDGLYAEFTLPLSQVNTEAADQHGDGEVVSPPPSPEPRTA